MDVAALCRPATSQRRAPLQPRRHAHLPATTPTLQRGSDWFVRQIGLHRESKAIICALARPRREAIRRRVRRRPRLTSHTAPTTSKPLRVEGQHAREIIGRQTLRFLLVGYSTTAGLGLQSSYGDRTFFSASSGRCFRVTTPRSIARRTAASLGRFCSDISISSAA